MELESVGTALGSELNKSITSAGADIGLKLLAGLTLIAAAIYFK